MALVYFLFFVCEHSPKEGKVWHFPQCYDLRCDFILSLRSMPKVKDVRIVTRVRCYAFWSSVLGSGSSNDCS